MWEQLFPIVLLPILNPALRGCFARLAVAARKESGISYTQGWAGAGAPWVNLYSKMLFAQVPTEDGELDPEMFTLYLVGSIMLVCMAGLMSGLTLGLMSLDMVELEVGSSG